MGAVLRGECQGWALDTKQTCFGVSFDGKAAFPSVDRDIQGSWVSPLVHSVCLLSVLLMIHMFCQMILENCKLSSTSLSTMARGIRLIFGAHKTKVTITGSKVDMR